METINTLVNTCYLGVQALGPSIRTVAYYSHLVPIFFTLALSLLVFFKAPKNLLSKIFLSFSLAFSFWLIADLITWVSNNYYLVYAFWAPVDYIETVFFVLGLYFVLVFINKKDISIFYKLVLFIITLTPFFITVFQKSVLGFNYSTCEGLNNNFLLQYRFIVEILVVTIILFCSIFLPIKKSFSLNKKSFWIVLGSMFLFLTVFGFTSYLSAATGNYYINLYALFIIPLFLIAIIYSIFNLDIFNLQIVSTYFIVFGFIILTASQLIFITSTTNKLLTIGTVIMSVFLAIILFRNLKKESDQRVRIEKLSVDLEQSKWRLEETNMKLAEANEKLKSLDRLKTEFVSLASHQLRSPLTAIKGYSSMLLEGDYGDMNPQAKETVNRIMESSNNLTLVVEDLLDVSKIESGGMKYEMAKFDLSELVNATAKELSITAQNKGLKLTCDIENNNKYFINGDREKIRQVLINIIDNSMKYTKTGQIDISLRENIVDNNKKVLLAVKDTGAGIRQEAIKTLFKKFSRGDGAKLDSAGSGLGLYLAKEITDVHKGKIWVESEGLGKGSTFFIELGEFVD